MILTVVSRALNKRFRGTAFYSAVDEMRYTCVPEPPSFDTVSTKLVNTLSFTEPVATFVKHEIEKSSLDKGEKEKPFEKLPEAVEEKKINIENGILTKRKDSVWFPSPPESISNDKKRIEKRTVQQRLSISQNSAVTTYVAKRGGAGAIVLAVTTAFLHPRHISKHHPSPV